ncbi:MAG: tRNA (adenosine(37)-N6)-dimethylallyltransferase MiaA [Flavobacteriaceae bacterium]
MNKNKTLIYVAGPTAVGKTEVAIKLAQFYQTEIVSCDSRQFYREMKIGTAPPNPLELAQVPHHFIQHMSLSASYNVGRFEKDALTLLEGLFLTHDVVIMVGGSGLYADAVIEGLDTFPEVPATVREQLHAVYKATGITGLQELLKEKDFDYYQRVDRQNPQRIIRALGVSLAAGKPYSSFLEQTVKDRFFTTKTIVLDLPRHLLYERINKRVDQMIAAGLEYEAAALRPFEHHAAFKTVGYQEWIPFWEGNSDRATVIEHIKRNSRRYAKRQITWFKKYGEESFYDPNTPISALLA